MAPNLFIYIICDNIFCYVMENILLIIEILFLNLGIRFCILNVFNVFP